MLESIHSPLDLRKLKRGDLPRLAADLRQCVLDNVSQTGGHLSSNLGTVELTVALHYVLTRQKIALCGMWGIKLTRTKF